MISMPHRRSRALLTALVTLSVPGALTLAAVAGHLRAMSAQSAASTVTTPWSDLSTAMAVPRTPAVHARGKAVDLLIAAAAAGESVPYQGVELISRWTLSGPDTVLASVWHARGGHTVTKTTEAASLNSGFAQVSYDPYQQSPEGVFGVTKPLIALLATHYLAELGGASSVAGRPATIVNVTRPGGSLAARFWIDRRTSLPLRREDYDSGSHMISEAAFIQLGLGGDVALPMKTEEPPKASVVPPSQIQRGTALDANGVTVQPDDDLSIAWTGAQVPSILLTKLRGSGWALPGVLPGGLSLYAAAVSQILDSSVVDLSYSDGLSEVSLFVQRGILAPKLTGWQLVKIAGKPVYASSRGVTWSARGYVYTVMADAPPQTIAAAVGVLPHDTSPGFWVRMGRGFQRLAGLVNPFH
jgi:hypothetical protein